MKFNTGLDDLDKVLNSKGLDIAPMPIDKEIFDTGILPLLSDYSLKLTDSERFEHLHNIWINYYLDISKRVKPTVKFSRDNNDVVVPMNGLYTPMQIIDLDGTVIDTTPPLLRAEMIPGMTEILANYQIEHKHNPLQANVKLIETFKAMSFDKDQDWIDFLDRYGVSKSESVDDSDQGLIEG